MNLLLLRSIFSPSHDGRFLRQTAAVAVTGVARLPVIKVLKRSIGGAIVCFTLLHTGPVSAQTNQLRYDLRVDLPVTATALASWVTLQALQPKMVADSCRWCNPGIGLDESARDALKWTSTSVAHTVSNVTGFVLTPASAVGLTALSAAYDNSFCNWSVDLLIIAEATTISQLFNQIVKLSVARERPFVHALSEQDKPHTDHPSENNVSFYSGHTNLTFALAVSSATVALMRGYRLAPLVWSTGLVFATMTGYLRIAADKHYLSDVLVGAVTGSAFGFAVPYLFHRPAKDKSPRSEHSAPSYGVLTVAPTRSGAFAMYYLSLSF